MYQSILLFFLTLAAGSLLDVSNSRVIEKEPFVLADFSNVGEPGQFPSGWGSRGGDGIEVYRLESEDDNLFLRAESKGKSVTAGVKCRVSLRIYHILQWKWRVHKVPPSADERDRGKNDNAAAVYIVFEGGMIPKTLKYVWSSSLPVRTTLESPRSSRTKIVVLESGTQKTGIWIEETINAYQDYKKLFGSEPRMVKAVAILSDSDDTKEPVMADYDDIVFFTPDRVNSKKVKTVKIDNVDAMYKANYIKDSLGFLQSVQKGRTSEAQQWITVWLFPTP